MDDLRKYRRFPVDMTLTLTESATGRTIPGRMRDMAFTGVGIEIDAAIDRGTVVTVTVTDPRLAPEPVSLGSATVVHRRPAGSSRTGGASIGIRLDATDAAVMQPLLQRIQALHRTDRHRAQQRRDVLARRKAQAWI